MKLATKTLLACTAVAALAGTSEAAVIAQYRFENNNSVSNLDANLTANVFTDTSTGYSGTGAPEGNRWTYFDADEIDSVTEPTEAQIEFAFSLTPTAGNQITLDASNTVTWFYGGFGETTNRTKLFVASDIDFTNILASSDVFTFTSPAGGGMANSSAVMNSSVSSASTLYFGVALADNKTGGTTYTTRIDNVVVNGAVTVIPEPSSLALLGLGGLLMAKRRRRD